ncbi:ATPase synthesis protein 25 mitochondrial [Coniothyrium glycines]
MSVPRIIPSRFVCNACRTASCSPSSRLFPASRALAHSQPLTCRPLRSFATSTTRRHDKHHLADDDPEFLFPDAASQSKVALEKTQSIPTYRADIEDPALPAQAAATPADASIPWYLRESPRYMKSAMPGQQPTEIPDLPANPPPLLETLLQYISVTAGLDNLQLLDLRHLDPPPALGSKLIMIIGTARSEKHLHVAADRFCRYLRREHGLKANAAGLLGRNELKIKLRRKAKRMRMLANVGGTMPEGNIDDGIRTGWICCTLGKLEAHPEDQHIPGHNVQEFVGFRDIKPGVNVVVQMFTEEKRVETDLETLWGGVVRTHQRKDQSADEALQQLEQDIKDLEDDTEEVERLEQRSAQDHNPSPSIVQAPKQSSTPVQQFRRPQSSAGDLFPPASNSDTSRQLRRLHTIGLDK